MNEKKLEETMDVLAFIESVKNPKMKPNQTAAKNPRILNG